MVKNCKTCKYHDDFSWVCFNPDSIHRADFTDNDFVCEVWCDSNGTDTGATEDRE